MDYEKKYKEALERAKKLKETCDSTAVVGWCEYIFPELKESEDERIRKWLVEMVEELRKANPTNADYNGNCSNAIAWLEKQGEKPVEEYNITGITSGYATGKLKEIIKDIESGKVEKFKVGDWVVNKFGDVWHIDSFDKKNYQVSDVKGNYNYFPISKQDEMHLWTIEEAKTGDVLALSYESQNYILIYKGLHEKNFDTMMSVFCSYYVEKDTYEDETDSFHVLNTGEIITPATKEQRDTLERAMTDAGYTFDFDKKELKEIEEEVNGEDYGIDSLYHAQRILEKTLGKVDGYQSDDGILEHKCAISTVKKLYEQKPEWSEEDEKLLALSLNNLTELKDRFGEEYGRTGDCIEWLKSLKDRYTWKPSDEQIEALLKLEEMHVLEHEKNQENAHLYMVVKSIREQLLKLREE